jgi:hypothetical protein
MRSRTVLLTVVVVGLPVLGCHKSTIPAANQTAVVLEVPTMF